MNIFDINEPKSTKD